MTTLFKHDIETQADIAELVALFYGRIRQHDELGFIFDDVAQVNWETHLPKIIDFWTTVLFGTQAYKGNPMIAHLELGQKTPIHPHHFDEWLALFIKTVDELFEGERAEVAKMRAQSIAVVLQSKLYTAGLLHY